MRTRIPLWVKIAWTLWVLVWLPIYWRHYGPQNFLWFCDLANILIGAALWMESPLLASWQSVSILLVQIVYTFDLSWRAAFGWHPIGGTEYMWDASNPLFVRLLSLFHVTTPPVLVWLLLRLGYDRRALALQVVAAWIVLPLSFCFSPSLDINWVWGPVDRMQTAMRPWTYFMLCLVGYPLILYLPSHLALSRLFRPPGRIGYPAPR